MEQHTTMPAAVTVGLDVGDRSSYLCSVDAAGAVVEEGRVATTPVALRQRFAGAASMRIVLETGSHSPWISRLLADCRHEVLVANARRVPLISQSDTKSNRSDAEALARIGTELLYWERARLMAVELRLGAEIALGAHTALFQANLQSGGVLAQYDPHPDGQRFVVAAVPGSSSRLAVISNVLAGLER